MSVLSGMTVIELCEVWQGPLAGQTLADYGARVIKIERPPAGDLLRASDFSATKLNKMSSYFAASNSNKESVCLDLKSEAGRQALIALIKSADILLCNYRPGVMDRLGFDYDQVVKINPRLVYAVATGYGETGPLAKMAGQDLLIQAVSGITTKHSGSKESPTLLDVPFVDFASGMLLVQGILFALLERQKSGLGQKVSVSLFDTAIAMQSLEIASTLNYDVETSWFNSCLNFIARTSDGWVLVLGFYRDNPLKLMCKALNLPDLSERKEFKSLGQQVDRREELAELLRPAILMLTSEEAATRFQSDGILAAPMLTLKQALASAQFANNKHLRTVPVEGQPDMQCVMHAIRFSRTQQSFRHGPPKLGQHTREVLAEIGLNATEIGQAAGANSAT